MTVGLLTIKLRISHAQSLKDKRSVVRGLLDRVSAKFNVAVAETAFQDIWDTAEVSIVTVSTTGRHVNSMLDTVLDYVEATVDADVAETSLELLT